MNAQDKKLQWFLIATILTALPLMGALIGAFISYMIFVQLEPQYKATAVVQNVLDPKAKSIENGDSQNYLRSRGDSLVIVKTTAVLQLAVEMGQLTQNRKLAGKSTEEIVNMLKNSRTGVLTVRLASQDINSNIFEISATTNDAELSAEIVHAIVAGYESFINQQASKTPYYSIQSIVRLEVPTIGSFAGPYWTRYLFTGALIGFGTVLAIELLVLFAISKTKRANTQQLVKA